MKHSPRFAARITSSSFEGRTSHYTGTAPDPSGAFETRTKMPRASVLLIERSQHGVYVIRYAANGRFAGDTWHETIEDAKHQVAYEFGDSVSDWKEVPVDINDVVAFMISG
jgi:hypothetical protein